MQTERVPNDRLVGSEYTFEKPSLDYVRECFGKIHETSEKLYCGGGAWEERYLGPDYPPVYRNTAWRAIGYAQALEAEDNEFYRQRIMEGVEYLLTEQQGNGSFLWWCYETHGHPDSQHLLYCTSGPGVAFLEAHRLTQEERFLEASRRAAHWEANFGISSNNNYNSFAVWHLAEHYRVTGEEEWLEAAIRLNTEGASPRQLPNGAWAGHNSWIFYHSIIVRGFAVLMGVLPDDHEAMPELRKITIMAINHLINEQRGSGHFRSCFDPEEWEKSRDPKSAYSVHDAEFSDPFALHALLYIQELTDLDVTNVLYGILGAALPEDLDGQGSRHLAWGAGYRWLAEQT